MTQWLPTSIVTLVKRASKKKRIVAIFFLWVEMSQPNIPARAKVSRKKAGLSISGWCPRFAMVKYS